MKTPNKLMVIAALLLMAGCARESRPAKYSESNYSNPDYNYTTGGSTYNGTASLSGETAASSIPNHDPNNQTGDASLSAGDRALVVEVREAIHNDPSFVTFAPNIQVKAQGGSVTLTGNVTSEEQKKQLESLVKARSGVVTVINQVQISSQSQSKAADPSSKPSVPAEQAGIGTSAQPSLNGQTTPGLSSTPSDPSAGLSPTSDKGNDSTRIYSNGNSSPSSAGKADASASSPLSASGAIVGSADASNNSDTNKNLTPGVSVSSPVSSQDATGAVPATPSSANQGGSKDLPQVITGSQSSSSANEAAKNPSASPVSEQDKTAAKESSSAAPASTDAGQTLSPTSETKSGRIYSSADSTDSHTLGANVQGTTDLDRTLGQEIVTDLKADSAIGSQVARIKIMVDGGKVTLRGKVQSEDQKKSIESGVKKISGVNNVDNQLSVSASTSTLTPTSNQ